MMATASAEVVQIALSVVNVDRANEVTSDQPDAERACARGAATVVIRPSSNGTTIDLQEHWRYRELLMFLIWKDIKVRYKQTVLGGLWAVLQPLAMMVVFSVFLGRVASSEASAVPYPLFVLCGLLPWMFLAAAVSSASQSIVGNQNMVSKIYFPRLLMPASAVGAAIVDFGVGCGLLAVMMCAFRLMPGAGMLLVPIVVTGMVTLAVGLGVLLAALTVLYRDFRYVIPFAIQFWMFATPSIYLQDTGGHGVLTSALVVLNPAHGLIAAFRAAVLNGRVDFNVFSISMLASAVLLCIGVWYFQRVERIFADII